MMNRSRLRHKFSGGMDLPFIGRLQPSVSVVHISLWVLLAITLVWFFSNPFFGILDDQDEAYMVLCCKDYQAQPLAMLTFFTGKLWMDIFGEQILALRMLASVCYIVAALFPVGYFYHRTGNKYWAVLLFVVVLINQRCDYFRIYNWDTGAYPWESIMLTLLMCYIDSPSRRKALAVGILLAFMVMARTPVLLIGLPVCAVVLAMGARKAGFSAAEVWKNLLVAGMSFLIMVFVCVILMEGSWSGYMMAWNTDNIISGHGTDAIGSSYLPRFLHTVNFEINTYRFWRDSIVAILVLLLLSKRSRDAVGLCLLVFLCLRRAFHHQVALTAWAFVPMVLLFYPPVYNFVARRLGQVTEGEPESIIKIDCLKVFTVLSFAFLPAVGSDMFVMRIVFFYSIPLLMVPLYRYRNGILKWILILMTVPALSSSIWHRYQDLRIMTPVDNLLPHHCLIVDMPQSPVYMADVAPKLKALKNEGKRIGFFGEDRYGASFMFVKEKPFKFNTFHYYSSRDAEIFLREFSRNHDVVVVREHSVPSIPYKEVRMILLEEGFEEKDKTGTPARIINGDIIPL